MGGSVESFEEALGRASLPPWPGTASTSAAISSSTSSSSAALAVRIGGRTHRVSAAHLLRAISEPPRAPEVLAFRRGVLEELASSEPARGEVEAVYTEIVKLRTLLCAGRLGVRWLRRLEILRAAHQVFAVLAGAFEGASSGLSRLREFGRAVCAGEAYGRLDALLNHEEHLGADRSPGARGRRRRAAHLPVIALRENSQNPFYSSPLGRFWAPIRLLVRGFRVNGGEVLEQLFNDVFTGLEASLGLLFQLLGDLEFYLAGLSSRNLTEPGARGCLPELTEPGEGGMAFTRLWNPLLLGDKTTPIPCDIGDGAPHRRRWWS